MSEYDDLLEQCKTHSLKLKEMVPKMYDALIKENIEPKEAKDRIKKDLIGLGWNNNYILSLLPEEAKEQTKPKKIQKNESSEQEVEIINEDGTVSVKKGGEPDSSQPSAPALTKKDMKSLSDAIREAITNSLRDAGVQVVMLDTAQCPKCRDSLDVKYNNRGRFILS